MAIVPCAADCDIQIINFIIAIKECQTTATALIHRKGIIRGVAVRLSWIRRSLRSLLFAAYCSTNAVSLHEVQPMAFLTRATGSLARTLRTLGLLREWSKGTRRAML